MVGEFASERRQLVTYDQIPPVLRDAILAAEDSSFFTHSGLRIERIFVTLAKDILHRRLYGASTLTQQLARKLFLTDDKTPERKIKEALLTVQIEKRYTKPEIFTIYCNKMYWGHLIYGVEAASQLYFGKHVSDLNLTKRPSSQGSSRATSARVRMSTCRRPSRRNYTLDRMAAEGYVKRADAEAAKSRPIVTRGQPSAPRSIAPAFRSRSASSSRNATGPRRCTRTG